MDARAPSPRFNIEGFNSMRFVYEPEDDIAYLHIDGPQAAATTEVDDGWYIRSVDGEVVGMELHGFKRQFLATPYFAMVFGPAMGELQEHLGGTSFLEEPPDGEEVVVRATVEDFPKTTHLMIFMIGQAIGKFEAHRQTANQEAARVFFSHASGRNLATAL